MIEQAVWIGYIDKLRAISDTAGEKMLKYMQTHDLSTEDALNELYRYGQALSTRYGEAAAALSADMYDAIVWAEYQDAISNGQRRDAYRLSQIKPAEPAATATYSDVVKTIKGTMKTGNNEIVAGGINRLVKLASVDTTLNNAIRDGAECAWIPHGDTCAYCLMLASNGWRKASKKAIRNGHAEHVHGHCDCTYAVRHTSDVEVEGYNNGTRYLSMYRSADGDNWKDKVNSMRREIYAGNKESVRSYTRKRQSKLLNSSDAELFNVDDWQPALDTPFD